MRMIRNCKLIIVALVWSALLAVPGSASALSLDYSGPAKLSRDSSLFFGPGAEKVGFLKQSARVIVDKYGIKWSRIVVDAWISKSAIDRDLDDPIIYTRLKKTYIFSSPQKGKIVGYYKAGAELALFPELGKEVERERWLRVAATVWVHTKFLKEYVEPPIELPPDDLSAEEPLSEQQPEEAPLPAAK
ncbi:MAG: hypothetical protein ACE5GM_06190 [bacterium]